MFTDSVLCELNKEDKLYPVERISTQISLERTLCWFLTLWVHYVWDCKTVRQFPRKENPVESISPSSLIFERRSLKVPSLHSRGNLRIYTNVMHASFVKVIRTFEIGLLCKEGRISQCESLDESSLQVTLISHIKALRSSGPVGSVDLFPTMVKSKSYPCWPAM